MKQNMRYAIVLSTLALSASPLMAQRPLGIDVSSYQGSINWSSVASSGVKFAFAKATEGTYYKDAYFATNMKNGKAAGVLMGAYEFARPDLDTPLQEANYFWNDASAYIKADGKSLMPMIDFETFNGHVGATSYTQWFNDWAADIIADGHAAGVTLRPVIYCSAGSGACYLTTNITLQPFIANYNGENIYTGTPWSCCSSCNCWGTWVYWDAGQGSIPGISGEVDLLVFNGTYTQLKNTELVTSYP